MLVTGKGAFQAQLIQIALHRLRISAGEEKLPRIALFAVPAEFILVALPISGEPMPVWGGIRMRAGEIIPRADRPIYMRTEGACRWSWIWVPAADFVGYGSAMTGNSFSLSSAAQWWRLQPATSRYLRQLHAAAVNLVGRRSTVLSVAETAHGLEQQLIEALVECFSKGQAIEAMPAATEKRNIAARFKVFCKLSRSNSCRSLRSARLSAYQPRSYEFLARSKSAWGRPSMPAAGGCNTCTEPCETGTRPRRAFLKLPGGTASAIPADLPPIIGPSMANCHQPPCGEVCEA